MFLVGLGAVLRHGGGLMGHPAAQVRSHRGHMFIVETLPAGRSPAIHDTS
jgi:hypothetical protein